jgi:hypothetical protein
MRILWLLFPISKVWLRETDITFTIISLVLDPHEAKEKLSCDPFLLVSVSL